MKYDRILAITKRGEQSLTYFILIIIYSFIYAAVAFYLGEPDGMAVLDDACAVRFKRRVAEAPTRIQRDEAAPNPATG